MKYQGGGALAESEDEWGQRDEQEIQDMMVSAEESIPVGFMFTAGVSVSLVTRSRYPLWSLEADGVRLEFRSPLVVVVEQDDSEIIISNPTLRIWGSGPDKYRALADFSRTFIDVLRSYEATPPFQLADDAAAYLRQLTSLIRKREAA